MFIDVAVDCKSDSRQENAKVFRNFHGMKIWNQQF